MNKCSLLIICRFVLPLLCTTFVAPSSAIIIRHDVGPARYEVRESSYPSVFFLEQQGNRKVCAATVIHQQWALTAAHCVEQTLLGNTLANGRDFAVLVGGQDREIDAVIIHPKFDIENAADVDLALLRFKQASTTPRAMPLHLQELEPDSIELCSGGATSAWEQLAGNIMMAVFVLLGIGSQMLIVDSRYDSMIHGIVRAKRCL